MQPLRHRVAAHRPNSIGGEIGEGLPVQRCALTMKEHGSSVVDWAW